MTNKTIQLCERINSITFEIDIYTQLGEKDKVKQLKNELQILESKLPSKNKKSKRVAVKSTTNCLDCKHCQYHSEGDSYCDITLNFVLEDWCPTSHFKTNCKIGGDKYDGRKRKAKKK